MATPLQLYQLLPDVLGRVEEDLPPAYSNPPAPPNPTGAPDGPTFWNLRGEVYVAMVDAMFMAALASGTVQQTSVSVTLAPETTYFALQNNTAIGIPKGVIAALRMRAPYEVRKTTLRSLDNLTPTWQQAPASDTIVSWFPLGVSMFGIYPQLEDEADVVMDFLISPVNQARPYDGTQPIPFQQEFTTLLTKFSAASLRTKEGTAEAEEADVVYQQFMDKMRALTAFQSRLDSMVFTTAFGAASRVNFRESV